jgi:hypothetical protein
VCRADLTGMSVTAPPQPGRPRVVAAVAVSLYGATTGFAADVATYYELAAEQPEDAT